MLDPVHRTNPETDLQDLTHVHWKDELANGIAGGAFGRIGALVFVGGCDGPDGSGPRGQDAVLKTLETHSEELVEAIQLISDIIIGPELRVIKEYVTSINESLSLDHANFGQKMDSALATIREDALAISADLRKTKLEMESECEKWDEEITNLSKQHQDSSENLSKKINATENSLATNVTKFREHVKASLTDLAQEHANRFTAIEDRLVQCEEKSSLLKEENTRLMIRLTNAAQSLATVVAESPAAPPSSNEQAETLLSEVKEKQAEPEKMVDDKVRPPEVSKDSTSNKSEPGNYISPKDNTVDIDTVLHEV